MNMRLCGRGNGKEPCSTLIVQLWLRELQSVSSFWLTAIYSGETEACQCHLTVQLCLRLSSTARPVGMVHHGHRWYLDTFLRRILKKKLNFLFAYKFYNKVYLKEKRFSKSEASWNVVYLKIINMYHNSFKMAPPQRKYFVFWRTSNY